MSAASSAAVTFAIPFYTGTAYLARTLASVVAQADGNWQAVVCDDGPEQGVEEIVRGCGDARVRYLRNPRNLGMAGNFNQCLDVAETDLVTVLHADDELMSSYCGTMRAAAARHPQAAAIFARVAIIDERGQPRFSLTDLVKDRLINPAPDQELTLEGEAGVRALLKGNFIAAPTLCYRKSTVGARRFREGLKFVLDWEMTTGLLLDGKTLVGLPTRCYRYRRHDEAATSKYTRTQLRFHEESAFYDEMRDQARARGWDDCVKVAAAKRFLKLNLTYRSLKSAAMLELGEARRGFRLLREL